MFDNTHEISRVLLYRHHTIFLSLRFLCESWLAQIFFCGMREGSFQHMVNNYIYRWFVKSNVLRR